jgi:hypothetical protein
MVGLLIWMLGCGSCTDGAGAGRIGMGRFDMMKAAAKRPLFRSIGKDACAGTGHTPAGALASNGTKCLQVTGSCRHCV